MEGREIDLSMMLARRESRSKEQNFLRTKYEGTCISFTMNIPGPIKTNRLIRRAFENGKNLLMARLEEINAEINHVSEIHEDTGDELLLSVKNIPASKLKDIAIDIENSSLVGRLYDIDVIDAQGIKLSRQNFRKCIICDRQAQECARSRTHTVQEMQKAIEEILS